MQLEGEHARLVEILPLTTVLALRVHLVHPAGSPRRGRERLVPEEGVLPCTQREAGG